MFVILTFLGNAEIPWLIRNSFNVWLENVSRPFQCNLSDAGIGNIRKVVRIFKRHGNLSENPPNPSTPRVLKLQCADRDNVERFIMFVNVRKGCI